MLVLIVYVLFPRRVHQGRPCRRRCTTRPSPSSTRIIRRCPSGCLGLLPAAVHPAGRDLWGRGRRHGRGAVRTFALVISQLPARRAGGRRRRAAQCGRHAHEPGLHRQRPCSADLHRRGQEFRQALPRQLPRCRWIWPRARCARPRRKAWFGSVVQIINHITLLSIMLTGAALIRGREHGTIEHLLVMPVTPAQIMLPRSGPWPGGADRLLPCPQSHGARRPGRAHRGLPCRCFRGAAL